MYTVSQKIPNIFDCNLKKDNQILIIFVMNIFETTCRGPQNRHRSPPPPPPPISQHVSCVDTVSNFRFSAAYICHRRFFLILCFIKLNFVFIVMKLVVKFFYNKLSYSRTDIIEMLLKTALSCKHCQLFVNDNHIGVLSVWEFIAFYFFLLFFIFFFHINKFIVDRVSVIPTIMFSFTLSCYCRFY